jgi:hypothetical protein
MRNRIGAFVIFPIAATIFIGEFRILRVSRKHPFQLRLHTHPLSPRRLVLRVVPYLFNLLARPVLLINSVLPTKHSPITHDHDDLFELPASRGGG